MKLSEKGLKSFADQMLDIAIGLNEKEVEWDRDFAMRQIEFEPDDFKGCVVLALDEAKAVLECVEACTFDGEFEGFVSNNKLLRDRLTKQITQAEKGNE